jgi:hypothetical protein
MAKEWLYRNEGIGFGATEGLIQNRSPEKSKG